MCSAIENLTARAFEHGEPLVDVAVRDSQIDDHAREHRQKPSWLFLSRSISTPRKKGLSVAISNSLCRAQMSSSRVRDGQYNAGAGGTMPERRHHVLERPVRSDAIARRPPNVAGSPEA
jgi:hypothetical protein